MSLTEFLLARIAEDERHARKLAETDHRPVLSLATTVNHPARVLAECEAKRRIVELHVPDRHLENWYWTQRKCAECGGLWHVITAFAKPTAIGPEQGCLTVRLLALPYADHPDYREEWKP